MAPRWIKTWVPQPVIAVGGKCSLFKWVREDTLKALEEKELNPEEPEATTEVLFLCSYEGCGRIFHDATTIRKHGHVHMDKRQHVCMYEGCGKKFNDSSKLKRHHVTHTGEKPFVCPYEGCGKAFSLDFNLKSHMRTHSLENYHVCSYPDCGRRFTHESKLISHIRAHHEKVSNMKHTPTNKHHSTPKAPAPRADSPDRPRPHACPYGCKKAYIHEYKLNLHLRTQHPGHDAEESDKYTSVNHASAKGNAARNLKRSNPFVTYSAPPKHPNRKGPSLAPMNTAVVKQPWPAKEMDVDDSSEENSEDHDNAEVGQWRHGAMNEDEDDDADDETEEED